MSRKIDTVIDVIRCIGNISSTRIELRDKIQTFVDSEYTQGASEALTDEELLADPLTDYLTYEKVVLAKTFSDAFNTFLLATVDGEERKYEKILNRLKRLTGK